MKFICLPPAGEPQHHVCQTGAVEGETGIQLRERGEGEGQGEGEGEGEGGRGRGRGRGREGGRGEERENEEKMYRMMVSMELLIPV